MSTIDVRWLAVGLGWMLLSFTSTFAQTATPNPDTILQDCSNTLPPDRPMPTGAAAPSIKIISPVSGTIIRSDGPKFADVTFTVEVSNFDLASGGSADNGNHWHLWLNNSVWGMYVEPSGFNGIPYGKWRICASVGNAEHVDIGVPDAIYLVVEKGEDGSGTVFITPTPDAIAPTAIDAENTPPVSSTDLPAGIDTAIAGIIFLGVAALGGGLWLGLRRSKSLE